MRQTCKNRGNREKKRGMWKKVEKRERSLIIKGGDYCAARSQFLIKGSVAALESLNAYFQKIKKPNEAVRQAIDAIYLAS